MKRILIVENDAAIHARIAPWLSPPQGELICVNTLDAARNLLKREKFQLVISAVGLSGETKSDGLASLGKQPLLLVGDHQATAIDTTHPHSIEQLDSSANDATLRDAIERLTRHRDDDSRQPDNGGMIGSSPAMRKIYRRIDKVAPTDCTVLISGETGTGKELVARAIHRASQRASAPFIAVNCAAIPETLIESELFGHEKGAFTGAANRRSGLIEAAEGGTLFLDEIGELPAEAQARLLRFIQEREIRRIGSNHSQAVDVRIVTATHRDLKALSLRGAFRPDLYYRIHVIRIDLPTLQQRGDDLLELADHLLADAAQRHNRSGLSLQPAAIQALQHYHWPGNIRELENVIEHAVVMSDSDRIGCNDLALSLNHLPADSIESEPLSSVRQRAPDPSEDLSLEEYFQRFVMDNQEHMNETELAKKLGISRKCLWERRQRFGIARQKSSASTSKSAAK